MTPPQPAPERSGLDALAPVLVHDYLLVMRGAERTFLALCDMWPHAPVATLLYDGRVFNRRLAGHPIRTSRLQRLGATQSQFKALLPLLPAAAERLEVSGHDLVVSSSSAFAHGVRPDPAAVHVCYCHTPFRYAWYARAAGIAQTPAVLRPLIAGQLTRIQRWDVRAAARGTHYVANSAITQERLARFWQVDAPIIHPPVELSRFTPGEPEEFLLMVCELVRHKRVDLALDAAARAGVAIKVVGGGADAGRLQALYGARAEFLGRLSDSDLAALYPRARALVLPNVEEFGITAVEAQAAGRPVIAAGAGGALETVVDGVTGAFFPPGDADALAELMRDVSSHRFDPARAVENAQRFSTAAFQRAFGNEVRSALSQRPPG